MAITIGGKTYKSYEEQILENKQNIENIELTPGPKGDKGDKGDNAVNPNFTASVGATVGTPAVTLTGTYPNLTLNFQNLKGQTGDKGDKGDKGDNATNPNMSATVDANIGTPSVMVSGTYPNLTLNFKNLKGQQGAKGEKGDSGVIYLETGTYVVVTTGSIPPNLMYPQGSSVLSYEDVIKLQNDDGTIDVTLNNTLIKSISSGAVWIDGEVTLMKVVEV